MRPFSFIIITYNEEIHLPRLFNSIKGLNAETFVLDSGSTDKTLELCREFAIKVEQHPFENHPKQWDYALQIFPIATPWVVCLDADHIVSDELFAQLHNFKNENYVNTNSIYFNRKNIFKGKWLKYGGYYPFYLLKMFRYNIGYSDLNENMDHRFIVPGPSVIWKNGHIIEENLKENNISFWIAKHNKYSDLVAEEEIERINAVRNQTIKPNFFGTPDERTAQLKKIWWKLPLYLRPLLYFIYRMIFKLGFLDGKQGIIFHFLQGFWFRLVVDIKIEEKLKAQNDKSI